MSKRIRTLIAVVPVAAITIGGLLAGTASTATQPQDSQQERVDPIRLLINQIDELNTEIMSLRQQVADAELRASTAEQDLAELRQFIADNDQYGQDFAEYERVKAIAEQESRQRELEQLRARRAQEEAQRRQRMREARAERDQRRAEQALLRTYREAGFSHLGQAVLLSRMSYNYRTSDQTRSRVDYAPGLGHYQRLYPNQQIDYSRMTFSGSVVNASDEVRNIGVAITFFDRRGYQVGNEIVEVRNARPDVPYPFTSTIDMALDRAFATSSQHVLYADPATPEDDVETTDGG